MKRIEILRSPSGETGVFGSIRLDWLGRQWPCLELPWADNEPQHSCIPPAPGDEATYRAILAPSGKWSPREDGRLYHVLDVPGRNLIKVHAATWAGDVRRGWHAELLGCLAPGRRTGELAHLGKVQACVLESRAALTEIMELLEGDELEITVRWDAGA